MDYTEMDKEKFIELNLYDPNEEKEETVSTKMPCLYWISIPWVILICIFFFFEFRFMSFLIFVFYIFTVFYYITLHPALFTQK